MGLGFHLYGLIVASIVFYINLISTIHKIVKKEDTTLNTIFGSLLVGFIAYCFLISQGH